MDLGQDIAELAVRFDHHVLHIDLNRPDKKNALIDPMYARMADLIERSGTSTEVRAILLTGAGDSFCSGNDVSTFAGMKGGVVASPPVRFNNALAHCEVPVVAAVQGHAVGLGTTLLLHCDFVVAAENAEFRTPFVNLGLCPEAGSSFTLPLRLGYCRAASMLLLGEPLNARGALAQGLVSAVYPLQEYRARAEEIALRLARQPATSTRATKKVLRAPLLRAIDDAIALENAEFAACMAAPEFAEAMSAFAQRRAPDFSRF